MRVPGVERAMSARFLTASMRMALADRAIDRAVSTSAGIKCPASAAMPLTFLGVLGIAGLHAHRRNGDRDRADAYFPAGVVFDLV